MNAAEAWGLDGRRTLLLLAVIILVGAGIRIHGIGDRPLWEDEAHYALIAEQAGDTGIPLPRYPHMGPALDGHPPLALHVFAAANATGARPAVALRAVSAVFGILTIPVIFLLGRELFGTDVGLLAAGLLAVSSNHIAFSRLIHTAAPGLFFLSMAVLLFAVSLRRTHLGLLGLSLLFGVFALLTHYIAFILLILFPFFLMQRSDRGRVRGPHQPWAVTCLALGGYAIIEVLTYLLAIVSPFQTMQNQVMLYNTELFALSGGSMTAVLGSAAHLFLAFIQAVTTLPVGEIAGVMVTLLAQYITPHLLYLPGVLALTGIVMARRSSESGEWRNAVFLLGWGVITLLFVAGPVYLFMSQTGRTPIRTHPFLIPPLMLLAARAVREMVPSRFVAWIPVMLLALYILHLPSALAPGPRMVDRVLDPGTDDVAWEEMDRYDRARPRTGEASDSSPTDTTHDTDTRGGPDGPP